MKLPKVKPSNPYVLPAKKRKAGAMTNRNVKRGKEFDWDKELDWILDLDLADAD